MEALGNMGWMILHYIVIIMGIAFIFYSVGSFFSKPQREARHDAKRMEDIEQKLDRIIELLEEKGR
ncbi:DUF4083 family protein [Bacillus pinisoli]|uniref:DUF4083 family protein n=1 Tax=Bacillus pinisoli TaxID=2901866 RepID=UPI001FF10490|nr:DUF4083 family protein [Bacillus pinisoli]